MLPPNQPHAPWIGADDPAEKQRIQAEHNSKMQQIQDFPLGVSEKQKGADDPRHALQKNGGLANVWHIPFARNQFEQFRGFWKIRRFEFDFRRRGVF